jgi:hypothetical protein
MYVNVVGVVEVITTGGAVVNCGYVVVVVLKNVDDVVIIVG